jgi:predicted acetyltransferase
MTCLGARVRISLLSQRVASPRVGHDSHNDPSKRILMTVIVTKASHSLDPIIQNLAQLYTHDFSEFRTDAAKGDLLLDRRFEAYPLEGYWTRPGWWASMIWCDEALAGFALINDHAHSGKPVDHSVSEFFVLRKYRGRGVGRLAAETIFSLHPGSWEVAVARKNVPAGAFWRKTITGAPKAKGVCEIDVSNDHWDGPIFRFEWSIQ